MADRVTAAKQSKCHSDQQRQVQRVSLYRTTKSTTYVNLLGHDLCTRPPLSHSGRLDVATSKTFNRIRHSVDADLRSYSVKCRERTDWTWH